MLGKIIERVPGMPYSQFVIEHVVQPMGMTSTTYPFLGTDRQLPEPYVKGYIYTSDTIFDVTISNISPMSPKGT